jgi:hypothetical protein
MMRAELLPLACRARGLYDVFKRHWLLVRLPFYHLASKLDLIIDTVS